MTCTRSPGRSAPTGCGARRWWSACWLSIGVAPFSIFMSEYQLLRAAIGTGAWLTLVLFLAASGVVFVSALRHLIDMAFGRRRAN